jgi:serine/threonine protein kinase
VAAILQLTKDAEPYPGYQLVQCLGQGGWGVVWKAVRRADNATFAIKFLPSDCQLAAAQEIRALQAIRQISHPNLVRIEQVWSCPGYLAIVMETADGNLLDLLEVYYAEFNVPIMADHLCYFLTQAAAAIDFLNARHHLVNGRRVAYRHGDVKPSNLLVQGRTVKLADFSLAVQTTASMWYHRRVGTTAYAAPELFQGWLSDRTDQYALAVTYYQLRTGRLPFPDTPTKFEPNYVRPVPNLSLLTRAEEPILVRALAPIPQDRWPTCAEMMTRLSQAVAAETRGQRSEVRGQKSEIRNQRSEVAIGDQTSEVTSDSGPLTSDF